MSGLEELRRLDWRFLLPGTGAPHGRAAMIGAAPTLVDLAHEVGFADAIVGSIEKLEPASCDAVAIFASDESPSVERVVASLRPGGCVYWEVDRSRQRWATPRRLIDQLERAGMTTIGVWAVAPGFDRAEAYVRIDVASPLPWFLLHQYRSRRPSQAAGKRVVRTVLRHDGRRLLGFSPLTAIVAVDGRGGEPGADILLTDGGSRSVGLRFGPGGVAPIAVAKFPKSVSLQDRTVDEHHTLVELESLTGGALARSVPRAIGLVPFGAVHVAHETPLVGRPLDHRVSPLRFGRSRDDLFDAIDWLSELQVALPTQDDANVHDWMLARLDEYEGHFGDAESDLIDGARAAIERLRNTAPLYPVTRHTDFNVWNLLRTDEGIAVLDWEGASMGPPMLDVIHCCSSWHELVGRLQPRVPDSRRFRRAFVQRRGITRADRAATAAIKRYCSALDIDHAWVEPLTVVTFADLAVRRHRQLIDGAGPPDDARGVNNRVRYMELLAGSAPPTGLRRGWASSIRLARKSTRRSRSRSR